jgi:hypothetical protein
MESDANESGQDDSLTQPKHSAHVQKDDEESDSSDGQSADGDDEDDSSEHDEELLILDKEALRKKIVSEVCKFLIMCFQSDMIC